MSTPDVLAVLERIERRLDALEQRLQPGLDALAQAPAAVGTAIDVVDRWAHGHADLDERLRRLAALADQLTDPRVLQGLSAAVSLGAQAQGMAGAALDIADAWAGQVPELDERLRRAAALLQQVTTPETLALLQQALGFAEQAPATVSTLIDVVDGLMGRLHDAGVDTGQLVPALTDAVQLVLRLITGPEVRALLRDTVDDGALLARVEAAAAALRSCSRGQPAAAGPLTLWRALQSKDVQTTLGFGVAFARALGERLPAASPSSLSSLAAASSPATSSLPPAP